MNGVLASVTQPRSEYPTGSQERATAHNIESSHHSGTLSSVSHVYPQARHSVPGTPIVETNMAPDHVDHRMQGTSNVPSLKNRRHLTIRGTHSRYDRITFVNWMPSIPFELLSILQPPGPPLVCIRAKILPRRLLQRSQNAALLCSEVLPVRYPVDNFLDAIPWTDS